MFKGKDVINNKFKKLNRIIVLFNFFILFFSSNCLFFGELKLVSVIFDHVVQIIIQLILFSQFDTLAAIAQNFLESTS